MRKRDGHAILALGLSSLLAISACGDAPPERSAAAPPEPVSVVVEELQPIAVPRTLEAVGTVQARRSAAIASKIVSYLRQVHVEAGDRVRPGQLLAELDDRDLVSNLRQAEAAQAEAEQAIAEASHALASAEAQLDLAEATHRRYAELLEKESVSRQEYDEVSAKLRAARAAVEMTSARRRQVEAQRAQAEAQIVGAQVALGYARIEAPFAGLVTERRLDPGSLASPGMPILMIDQAGRYRLEAAVPESQLTGVREGQSVPVVLQAVAERLTGRVAEIVPAVDPGSRSFIARIDLPSQATLRNGMFGRAVFPAGERTVLTVPADAVVTRGQIQSVFAVEQDTARRRLVSLGDLTDGRYEVLAGLQEFSRVVVRPGSLQDGRPVRIEQVVSPPQAVSEEQQGAAPGQTPAREAAR